MYQKPAMLTIVPKSNLHFVAIDKDDNDKDNLDDQENNVKYD